MPLLAKQENLKDSYLFQKEMLCMHFSEFGRQGYILRENFHLEKLDKIKKTKTKLNSMVKREE